jgi:hypothetical protein
MNRAIDTATAQQRGVGGIHNGVNVLFGNVAFDHYDSTLKHRLVNFVNRLISFSVTSQEQLSMRKFGFGHSQFSLQRVLEQDTPRGHFPTNEFYELGCGWWVHS